MNRSHCEGGDNEHVLGIPLRNPETETSVPIESSDKRTKTHQPGGSEGGAWSGPASGVLGGRSAIAKVAREFLSKQELRQLKTCRKVDRTRGDVQSRQCSDSIPQTQVLSR